MRTSALWLSFLLGCSTGGSLLPSVPPMTDDDDGDDDDDSAVAPDDDDNDDDDDDSAVGHEIDWSICVIELDCEQTVIWDEPKQNCDVRVTEGNGFELYAGLGGLERRGRSSLNWAKANYSLELWERPSLLLVEPRSDWRYWDSATPPAADWAEQTFDDAAWSTGTAPLGWNDWELQTIIQDDRVTSWHRHHFTVDDPDALDPVWLHARFDDGAVLYVNGVEVGRGNMPSGPVGDQTLAAIPFLDQDEVVWEGWPVAASMLQAGDNVLAVELHQIVADSSDAILDAALVTKPPKNPVDFFDMGKEEDWVLTGAYVDLTQYRNPFLFDLFNDFRPENYAPESHYCGLTVNGDWRGLYQLTEKIKRDDDRLDLVQDTTVAGGTFLLKNDDTRPFIRTDFVRGGWQLIYPKEHELSASDDAGIREVMADWEQASRGFGDLWEIVDFDSAVDWVLLQEFSHNGDAYNLSIHVYRNDGGKIMFVPWDFDLAFGLGCGPPEGFYIYTGNAPDFIGSMRYDPTFLAALADRYHGLRETVLSDEALDERLDDLRDLFGDTVDDNFDRWPEQDMIGADDWVLSFPAGCPTYTWDSSDQRVRGWIADRVDWLDSHIDNYPNEW